MSGRKIGGLLLLLLLCLALAGCRSRLTANSQPSRPEAADAAGEDQPVSQMDDLSSELDEETDPENSVETDGGTKENPEAARKEYDENAPAEIVLGTERAIYGEGEGSGAFAAGEDAENIAAKLSDAAKETATQTVPSDQAEKMGVAQDAQEADSAFTYYTVLMQDRMESLFECQRLNVYWETARDHVTVFKTSPEHSLILQSGAYDVSARLLEANLHVDDGWIGRKDPDMIVKAVDGGVLGAHIASSGAARQCYARLLARDGWAQMRAVKNGRVLLLSEEMLEAPHLRLAAMLLIAKCANPALMADVDIEKALEMLTEEATGSLPTGLYYYSNGQEGN